MLLPRNLRFLCVAFLLLAAKSLPSKAATPVPVTSIQDVGKGTVELTGEWEFHLGDNPTWASPDLDDSPGTNGWEEITADSSWQAQKHPGYTGFAWYRKHLGYTLAPGVTNEIALLDGGVDSASEVYWNGKMVERNGKLPPYPQWDSVQRAHLVRIGNEREGVLAFRVWLAPLDSTDSSEPRGGFENPPVLGDIDSLRDVITRQAFWYFRWHFVSQFVGALYGLIAAFCIVGWIRNRKQKALLWLAVFALVPFLGAIFDPNQGTFAIVHVRNCVLALGVIGEWFFLIHLLNLEHSPMIVKTAKVLSALLIILSALDAALVLLDLSASGAASWYVWTDSLLTNCSRIISYPFPFVLLAVARGKKLGLAIWLIALSAILLQVDAIFFGVAFAVSRYFNSELPRRILFWNFEINRCPVSTGDLFEILLACAFVYSYYRTTKENSLREQRLREELKSAQELQKVMIPDSLPILAGYHLTSAYRPALEVGGDFLKIMPFEAENCAIIVLGDVSGKGLRAAMAVSMILGMLRARSRSASDPARLLAEINGLLCGELQGGFATCIALRLEFDGACVVASAGHPAPFLNGQEMDIPGALPLGLVPIVEYEPTSFQFEPGDHLVLYTDGLLEARGRKSELFGFERLGKLLASRPDALTATDAAVRFGQDDDITVVTLSQSSVGQEATSTLSAPAL
jgi:hypothetical protein